MSLYYIKQPRVVDINLSKNLRSLREERGYTQTQLANLCGVSKNTISSLECNKCFPSLKLVVSLCIALDCNFVQLVECYDCAEEMLILL